MHVLLSCKNEEDPIKTEGARVLTTCSLLQVYGDFSRCSRAANSLVLDPIWPNFKLVLDIIVDLVTCKNEEDQREGARVLTRLNIDVSDVQGQLTPQSVVRFCGISTSSVLL